MSDNSVARWAGQARSLLESGQYAAAAACYRQALQQLPAVPELHFGLGMALQALGKSDEAVACLQETLRLNPVHAAAAIQLSRLMLIRGQYKSAMRFCLAALRNGARDMPVLQQFANLVQLLPDAHALTGVRENIIRCYESRSFDLQPLSRAVAEILKGQTRFADLLRLAQQGRSDELEQYLLAPGASGLVDHELLVRALTWTLFCDPDLEVLWRALRRIMLRLVYEVRGRNMRPGIVDDDCSFLAALACQCFNSDYCYEIEPDEAAKLEQLEADLVRAIAGRDEVQLVPARICVYGMYQPLHRLTGSERFLEGRDLLSGDAFSALLDLQLRGPGSEREIRRQIRTITPVVDETSRSVREMYEASPYPPWLTVTRRVPRPFVKQVREMFPRAALPALDDDQVDLLVAGCGTGKQAIMSAGRFSNSRVLAVDLSLSSLAYAQHKARQLGVENITFAQADILQLASLQRRFHVIESVGVLHHMEDPLRGLEVLAGMLRTNGLMNIGLYSALARRHILALQKQLRESGLQPTVSGIRRARAGILADDSESCRRVRRLADFYSISGCRDLLFHVSERNYRLPEIAGMLDSAGLRFLGFGWTDLRAPNRYQVENPEDTYLVDLSRWDNFEEKYPDTFLGMYVFWCQKV